MKSLSAVVSALLLLGPLLLASRAAETRPVQRSARGVAVHEQRERMSSIPRGPLQDGCHSLPADSRRGHRKSRTSVAVFVDRRFYKPLKLEIERFGDDIRQDLCTSPKVVLVNAARTRPEEIRATIQDLYRRDGLIGSVFIGDIPTAYWGDYLSQPPFATDAFYEDLDDSTWVDPDGNGIYNIVLDQDGDGMYDWFYKTWIGEHNREVWSGRLLPPASATHPERVEMLRRYLNRNHDYRSGLASYQRGVVYAESVRHNGESNDREDDFGTVYERAVTMMDGSWLFDRDAGDALQFVWSDNLQDHMNGWLAGVNLPYEYGFLNVHGSPASQWFGSSHYLFRTDYGTTPPRALLVDLWSCSNGDFTAPDYLAGWMLFNGDTLAVFANTTVVLIVGDPGVNPDHRLLSLGLTLGELRLADILSNDSSVLLGDPTLRIRARTSGPQVSYSPRVILPSESVADLPAGYTQGATAMVANRGTEPVTLHHRVTSLASLNGLAPWDRQFQFRVRDTLPITLAPGETRAVNLDFYYDGVSGPGVYRARFMLYTDSGATPFFWVEMEKEITP